MTPTRLEQPGGSAVPDPADSGREPGGELVVPAPGERGRQQLTGPLIGGKRGEPAQQFGGVAPDAGLLPQQGGGVDGYPQASG